jgi:amylosucrase
MTAAAFNDELFRLRLERSRDDLFGMLGQLYEEHPDFAPFTAALGKTLREAWRKRPQDLKWLDLRRDLEPDWFQRPGMAGYVFYIDRFAAISRACGRSCRISGTSASPMSISCPA